MNDFQLRRLGLIMEPEPGNPHEVEGIPNPGAGTPPVMTRHGWLILYHGVSKAAEPDKDGRQLCYSAGVMVLSNEHPRFIRYRSPEPVLTPESRQERCGTIADVVFPTGIDRRDDLGCSDRFDVYYGMADDRIGAARLDVPNVVPPGGAANPPQAKVDAPVFENSNP